MKKVIPVILAVLASALLAMSWTGGKGGQAKPSFNHLALNPYDLKKTAEFYERVVKLARISDPFNDDKHVWLHLGEHSQLHLIGGGAKDQVHPKDVHLSLTVDSVEAFIEHLKEQKVTYTSYNASGVVPVIRADGVKQVFFQDPDGFWIEVNNDRY